MSEKLTIEQNLSLLLETKTKMKENIIANGGIINDDTPFIEYVKYVGGSVSIYREHKEPTPVPNTNVITDITFNLDLPLNEIINIIKKLTFVDFLGTKVYPILVAQEGVAFVIIDASALVSEGMNYYILMKYMSETTIMELGCYETGETFSGNIDKSFNGRIEVEFTLLPEYEGLPVGSQNDLLIDWIYCGEKQQGYSKKLSGTYEPIILEDIKEETDLTTYMDNQQMPIKVVPKNKFKELINLTKSARYMFAQYKVTDEDIEKFRDYSDTENLEDARNMFASTSISRMPNMSTKNLIDASYMFEYSDIEEVGDFENPINAEYMFRSSNIKKIGNIKIGHGTEMFSTCTKLEEVTTLDTTNVGVNLSYLSGYCSMARAFDYCSNLKIVKNINCLNFAYAPENMFRNCSKLETLYIYNIKQKITIGSGTNYGHLLTLDSLINTIKELIDTGSTLTLTMGSANLEKLANTYVKLTGEAEEDENNPKLPFEVCESTDEGAMLITEYVTLKNWALS